MLLDTLSVHSEGARILTLILFYSHSFSFAIDNFGLACRGLYISGCVKRVANMCAFRDIVALLADGSTQTESIIAGQSSSYLLNRSIGRVLLRRHFCDHFNEPLRWSNHVRDILLLAGVHVLFSWIRSRTSPRIQPMYTGYTVTSRRCALLCCRLATAVNYYTSIISCQINYYTRRTLVYMRARTKKKRRRKGKTDASFRGVLRRRLDRKKVPRV